MNDPSSWAYDADLHCDDCARKAGMHVDGAVDGAGEAPSPVLTDEQARADTPQHCGTCGTFLENPLTDEGVAYVIEALDDHMYGGDRYAVLQTWADFYEDEIAGATDIFFRENLLLDKLDFEENIYEDLRDCASPGQDGTEACEYVLGHYTVVAAPNVRNHLLSYGAWEAESLLDHRENTLRLIWLLGGNLREHEPFCLEACPEQAEFEAAQSADPSL